jgi:hypothetical protein
LSSVVGGLAGPVLLTEIGLTRLFSVLLYHFSFLTVALALFGLAAGGLGAARDRNGPFEGAALEFLSGSLVRAAAGPLALVSLTVVTETLGDLVIAALLLACSSAVTFFSLGQALAIALAVGRKRIHRLYAVDLLSSAGAALAGIIVLRWVQGPLVLMVLGSALAALGGSRGLLIAAMPCYVLAVFLVALTRSRSLSVEIAAGSLAARRPAASSRSHWACQSRVDVPRPALGRTGAVSVHFTRDIGRSPIILAAIVRRAACCHIPQRLHANSTASLAGTGACRGRAAALQWQSLHGG